MSRTLLIAGPTGLIGDTTLRMALDDPRTGRVIALTRRSLGMSDPKLEEWRHDDLLAALRSAPVDAVICCLGTTIRKVGGDKAKFAHVDRDLVVGLGRWAKEQNVPVMCVVSAIGADTDSKVFYSQVKGEMEQQLKSLDLPGLHLFQPSVLTGPRDELRIGERVGIFFGKLFSAILPERYRPMPHDVLARALLNAAAIRSSGTYTYPEIVSLAEGQRPASAD